MQTVGIIGLGWLGFPLAKKLVEKGFKAKGSVRSEEKKNQIEAAGIDTIVLDVSLEQENNPSSFFEDCSVAIITIPPSKTPFNSYQSNVLKACSLFPENCQFIFTSSTSVYAEHVLNAIEDTKILSDYNFNSQLFLTEKALQQHYRERMTILRLGGLFGEDRNPAKFLAGKTELKNPEAPVNIVHQDDVVEVIIQLIENKIAGEIFNVCCDNHETRKVFYTKQCEKLNLPAPIFSDINDTLKCISNRKLKNALGFNYKHNFFD
jgi:nucleoside-diphosphate-sugar epimerase